MVQARPGPSGESRRHDLRSVRERRSAGHVDRSRMGRLVRRDRRRPPRRVRQGEHSPPPILEVTDVDLAWAQVQDRPAHRSLLASKANLD